MEDLTKESAKSPVNSKPIEGEILSPYTLVGSDAERMRVKPGTKVLYVPQDDAVMKRILGAGFDPNAIYMKDIYTEDGARRIGGVLTVYPDRKPENS